MRIAIVNLTSGGLSGGYAKYLRELIPRLRSAAGHQMEVFVHPDVVPRVRNILPDVRTWSRHDSRLGFRGLRQAIRAMDADVVFIPTARWLNVGERPTVVMVRNMEPLAKPFVGWVPAESVRNVARAYVAWRACHRATRVLAVSSWVRDFLCSRFRVAPSKIAVVPHGVEPAIPETDGDRPKAIPEDFGEFLFVAGSIRPARGLEDAVGAVATLAAAGRTIRLVIAGGFEPSMDRYHAMIMRQAARLGIDRTVLWAGKLDPAQMSWCLRHSRAFVMTSRVEACPNMVLEAMTHGCLSVSCDAPPMPEFYQRAALYYRTGDVADLARVLERALSMTQRDATELRGEGVRRAAAFTWDETARRTLNELEVASHGRAT